MWIVVSGEEVLKDFKEIFKGLPSQLYLLGFLEAPSLLMELIQYELI